MTTEEFIAHIPLAKKASVIAYDDCGLVAVNKGTGLMSHPNPKAGSQKPSFVNAKYNFEREYYSWTNKDGGKMHLHLVNRLDSPTSGVIICATNHDAAKAAKLAFKEKTAKKIYFALCKNRPDNTSGQWLDTIKKHAHHGHVRSHKSHTGDKAVTNFSMVRMDANSLGISLLQLEPVTGKTHQLRVQCAIRKVPVIGDGTYGDFELNKKIKLMTGLNRLFLHCGSTSLDLELDGKKISFSAEAPLPESFLKIIDYNNKIFSVTRGFRQ